MKLRKIALLIALISANTFAANTTIEGNIVCKITAERSAECFHADAAGNIDYDRSIEGNGLELAMALLEAGGQDEHAMGSTYVSANDAVCTVEGRALTCSLAQ